MLVDWTVAEEPPALSAAYLEFQPEWVLTRRAVSVAPVEVGSAPETTYDIERIQRRHRLGKTGVIVMAAGLSAVVVGTGVVVASVFADNSGYVGPALFGGGLLLGGGIAMVVGEVMLFTGGIGAAQLLDAPTTVGWVGVGLVGGAFLVNLAGSATNSPELSLAGSAMSLGGLVCGAVQLGQVGRVGRQAGVLTLQFAPTPSGFAVAGAF